MGISQEAKQARWASLSLVILFVEFLQLDVIVWILNLSIQRRDELRRINYKEEEDYSGIK